MSYRIKGWTKFQHFKDRKPPWVKLYRELLDDLEWHELDGKSAKVLVMLWLIASEYDGNLPNAKTLSFRLRMTEKEVISSCINLSHWLEQVDINTISSGYQETRVETETETETETDSLSSTRTPSQQLLSVFHEKCGLLPKVSIFSDKRKGTLKSRFNEVMKTEKWEPEQTIAWFGDFYESVNASKFLTGRSAPSRDGRSFRADWDWVHNPVNFVKIIEGKYGNGL